MALSGFSQNFDHLASQRTTDCSDISNNSGWHFIRLVQESKLDSAHQLVQYWESKCGVREPVFRAKILLALRMNEFSDDMLKPGTLFYLLEFMDRMDLMKSSDFTTYSNNKSHYAYVPPGEYFDMQTQKIAADMLPSFEPGSMEIILSEFYGINSDSLLPKIQSGEKTESPLALEYRNEVKKYLKMHETHFSVILGTWIPTGRLSKLGLHPELGVQIGLKQMKMNYDAVLLLRFANTPNEYYARRTRSDNSVELTNHFLGWHIGIDIGRDLYVKNRHELQLIGGVGVDGFQALREDIPNNHEVESTFTYNISTGVGYRFYVTNAYYVGLRCKYNFADYTLNNVINYTGNTITLQLVVGNLNNATRNDNLRALRYRGRR